MRRLDVTRDLRLITSDENGLDGRLLAAEDLRPVTIDVVLPLRHALDLIDRTHDDPDLRDRPVAFICGWRAPKNDGLMYLRLAGSAADLAPILEEVAELQPGPHPLSRQEGGRLTFADETNARLGRYWIRQDKCMALLGTAIDRVERSTGLLLATRPLVAQLG